MKPKITLSVDKTRVTEGDIVELSWSCENVDSVQFTLDNGYKTNTIPVEASGTKKFRLNRSKGRTHLVIGATLNGKTYYESVSVRVRKMKATKAENVYDYTGARGVRHNGLRTTWWNIKSRFRMTWEHLPENKRLAYKMLLSLLLILTVSAFWPPFFRIASFLLIGYLFWVILKR